MAFALHRRIPDRLLRVLRKSRHSAVAGPSLLERRRPRRGPVGGPSPQPVAGFGARHVNLWRGVPYLLFLAAGTYAAYLLFTLLAHPREATHWPDRLAGTPIAGRSGEHPPRRGRQSGPRHADLAARIPEKSRGRRVGPGHRPGHLHPSPDLGVCGRGPRQLPGRRPLPGWIHGVLLFDDRRQYLSTRHRGIGLVAGRGLGILRRRSPVLHGLPRHELRRLRMWRLGHLRSRMRRPGVRMRQRRLQPPQSLLCPVPLRPVQPAHRLHGPDRLPGRDLCRTMGVGLELLPRSMPRTTTPLPRRRLPASRLQAGQRFPGSRHPSDLESPQRPIGGHPTSSFDLGTPGDIPLSRRLDRSRGGDRGRGQRARGTGGPATRTSPGTSDRSKAADNPT